MHDTKCAQLAASRLWWNHMEGGVASYGAWGREAWHHMGHGAWRRGIIWSMGQGGVASYGPWGKEAQ